MNIQFNMKNLEPKIGQEIYVPSSYYIYRGEDDFEGGKATINKIENSSYLPKDHINYIMVGIEGRPNTMYNYKLLLEQQEELVVEFGDNIARPNPDHREEFNQPFSDWR